MKAPLTVGPALVSGPAPRLGRVARGHVQLSWVLLGMEEDILVHQPFSFVAAGEQYFFSSGGGHRDFPAFSPLRFEEAGLPSSERPVTTHSLGKTK